MSMTELRSDWLIGYYVLGREEFSAKGLTLRACMGDEGSG